MGFERSDNQPAGPEWAQPRAHAARPSIEAPAFSGVESEKDEKSKKKKKKEQGGRHRADEHRPAFRLADYQERERKREAERAALGAAVLAPGEIWKRSTEDDTSTADKAKDKRQLPVEQPEQAVEIDLHDVAAEPASEPKAETKAEHESPEPSELPKPDESKAKKADPSPRWEDWARPYMEQSAVGETFSRPQTEIPAMAYAAAYESSPNSDETESVTSTEDAEDSEPAYEAGPTFDVPPVPPSFTDYERIMREGPEPEPSRPAAAAASGVETSAPATAIAAPEIPVGLQRSPAEVSRAAWQGLFAGWWLGRRGKRKAVERARAAGRAEGAQQAAAEQQRIRRTSEAANQPQPAPTLEATPIHTPPYHEPRTAAEHRVTAVPLAVETRPPLSAPAAERPASRAAEISPAGKAETEATDNLSRSELLKIAKKIKIDGVRLKDVYSAKRIDEAGLRSVVESYMRGGDYRRLLSDEIIAKEQSFERDPYLRHDRKTRAAEVLATGASSAALATRGLLHEKGTQLAASSQKTAHKAGKLLVHGARQAQHDIIDTSNSADWIGITAVVIVYSLILILLLR